MNYKIFLLLVVLGFGACKTKKEVQSSTPDKTVSDNAVRKNPMDESIFIQGEECFAMEEAPKFLPVTLSSLGGALNGREMPKEYSIFMTDETFLLEYLQVEVIDGSSKQMPLPIIQEGRTQCRLFQLFSSNTMSEELRKKFPNVFSFKGFEQGLETHGIRAAYEPSKGLNAMMKVDNKTFVFERITAGERQLYIVYDRNKSSRTKEQFER